MFPVSDAMTIVGGGDHFSRYGQELCLVGGRLIKAQGALAGAYLTMAEGMAQPIRALGTTPKQALCMALTVPASVTGASTLL